MKTFSKREQIIFILCVIAVVIFMVNIIFVKPIKNNADALESEISNSRLKLQKQLKIIERGKKIARDYDDVLSNYRQTSSNEQVMSSILSEIEAAASQNGMKVSDIKPKRVREIDFYNQFSVSLSINGQLKDIAHFLYLLENPPHSFNIDELILEKNSPYAAVLDCRIVLNRILIP